jgi:aldose 1-epimerase
MAERGTYGRLPDGRQIDVLTLQNSAGMRIRAITYGCVIVSLETPDRQDRLTNIVLGFDRLERYIAESPYYGAVVGRYANRIANARFSIDGRTYHVSANEPPNHLHGGFAGFDKRVWEAEISDGGGGIVFRRRSADGEEGYPGNLDVQVTYTLTGNRLRVEYEAGTDAPTHVNLTQHSYFNLCGADAGIDVLGHSLAISASAYLPVTGQLIPTGEIAPVADTPFDFRVPVAIGARYGGNYDHNFLLDRPEGAIAPLAARLAEPRSGRSIEMITTEPGLQVYSGGHHRGICLETQHYPDSPNRPEFPSTVLRPGERYYSRTEFAFGIG